MDLLGMFNDVEPRRPDHQEMALSCAADPLPLNQHQVKAIS
jgi:hypothetical protein